LVITSAYEVRDFDLPDRPPLAYADDLEDAKAAVEQLHDEFFDQLDANGEGGSRISQSLSITSRADGQVQYISGVFGSDR
jgi:hypothetical protein